MPFDYITDAPVETALFGNDLQRLVHDVADIIADEGEGVHGGHIRSAVPSVAIAHYMSDGIGVVNRGVHHSRRHQPGIVRLNLEIYVVAVRIVHPEAAFPGLHPVQKIVTGVLVGMPQKIIGIGKCLCKRFLRCVKSQTLKNIDKCEIHINIVIQPGSAVKEELNPVLRPFDVDVVIYHRPAILELGHAAVGAADCLPSPAALNLVKEHILRKTHLLPDRTHGFSGTRFRALSLIIPESKDCQCRPQCNRPTFHHSSIYRFNVTACQRGTAYHRQQSRSPP